MFQSKQARFDAMNSLASYAYQQYEKETQKVHGNDQSIQNYFDEAKYLSNEASRIAYDPNGALTQCFASMMLGEMTKAHNELQKSQSMFD